MSDDLNLDVPAPGMDAQRFSTDGNDTGPNRREQLQRRIANPGADALKLWAMADFELLGAYRARDEDNEEAEQILAEIERRGLHF